MSNEIADRIAFFLKDNPPFSYISYTELEKLALEVTVRFLDKEEILFSEGETGNNCCYVLRKGNVKLTQKQNKIENLIDQCEPGEVFGVRSLLSGKNYVMSAKSIEESLVYEIPKNVFYSHLKSNQQFALFFTSGYAAGQVIARSKDNSNKLSFTVKEQPIPYPKKLLTCSEKLSIKESASLMSDNRSGSIIIIKKGIPQGIVTDTDFRNKVIAKGLSIEKPINSIMSSPVKTVGQNFSYSEILIKMIKSNLHHLIVTEDGTDKSKAIGMISDHDLMIAENNHPSALIKQLKKENDSSKWPGIRSQAEDVVADYLRKELSVEVISNFITAINDTLIAKAVEYAQEQIPESHKIEFCWMSLGSEGREEQLLRTDQDNAIIFREDDNPEKQQKILLKLAEIVNNLLENCGFEKCPGDIMAKNPIYCQSLKVWKKYFSNWINVPEPQATLNASIFFDFRGVHGNKELIDELEEFLKKKISKSTSFLNHLAANACKTPPPLSFFKRFLVEKSGKHVDKFDIKTRAMLPLSTTARVLIFHHHKMGIQNTTDRYRMLSQLDQQNKELYEVAAEAYQMMIKIRAKYGLENGDSGRFINIGEMNKLEKQILRSAFIPIGELQKILQTQFKLDYFN